jgi:MAF protein
MGCAGKDGRLVLASGSPRRREILESAGLEFEVVAPDVTEDSPDEGERAEHYAMRMARRKASSVATKVGRGVVLGADTVVVVDGAILGKPVTRSEAVEMLRRLRGRDHGVTTGMAVVDSAAGLVEIAAVTSTVHMRRYGDGEIEAYVASGEPFDKAGAYAVQDTHFRPADRVEGCYLNVVGLPLCRAAELLSRIGVPCAQGQVRGPGGLCADCGPSAGQEEGGE